jgi:hypothetical protein
LKIYFSEFKRCEDSTSIKTIRIVDFLKVGGRASCRSRSLHAAQLVGTAAARRGLAAFVVQSAAKETMRAARAAGKSIRTIAREQGVGIGTVSRLTA